MKLLECDFLPPGDDGTMDRSKMPQVEEKDMLDLLVFMGQMGFRFSAGLIDPKVVSAKQAICIEVCRSLPEGLLAKPVLLAGDKKVIDGDHRWYAHVLRGSPMPYIMFDDLTFEKALEVIFKFPRTYRSDSKNRRVA